MKKVLIILMAVFFAGAFAAQSRAQTAFVEAVTESDDPAVKGLPEGQWKAIPMKNMSGGIAIYTDVPGAALEFEFNGAAVAADVMVGKSSGMLSVTVDGKPYPAADLYSIRMEQGVKRIVLANNLTPGAHKLRLESLSSANPKSLGRLVDIDTLRVANIPYGVISGVLECKYNAGMPVVRAKAAGFGESGEVRVTTETSGEFILDALAPGTYSLRFEHPGFATLEQTNIAVASGQNVALPKTLLEENIGARPLTFIRNPLGVRPVFVRPGDEFPMEVAAPASASGWQAALESPQANSALTLKNASFDSGSGRWTLTVAAPAGIASLLYGIRLTFAGGEDFQPRAVMVVPAYKDSIRVVHLTDVHVYKSEQLFDKYRQLAEEINLINPDLVVVTGDLTDSNGYTDERWPESDQYPAMLDVWNAYNVPTVIVPGNHDLSPNNKDDDHRRWNRFFDTAEYSFNVGSYHFTTFDDSFVMASGPEKKMFREELFPAQLEWIEKDLAASSGAKMRILLYHVPLHNTKSKLVELAAKYEVKLALYGHLHMNQVEKVKSTTYVQTAAAYDGAYRVLNLDDGKIGEINSRKDGYSAFSLGTLKTDVKTSPDGRGLAVRVKNTSTRAFPGATWRAEMPSATDYTCNGCIVTARYPNGAKTLVMFTFDIPAKGETKAVLTAK